MTGGPNNRESGHAPKIGALLALQEGALSEQGERRIRRHLDGCDPCQQALSAMASYEILRQEIQDSEPRIDWAAVQMPDPEERVQERVEARVEARTGARDAPAEERERPSEPQPDAVRDSVVERAALVSQLSRRRWWVAGGLAAAAALALGVLSWSGPAEQVAKAPKAASNTGPAATELQGWAMVYSEGAEISTGLDGFQPLSYASTVAAGAVVRVTEGAILDLALESGATLRLQSAEVRFARLDSQVIELQLRRGEVAQRVPPLRQGASYRVSAAGYQVRVHGTHFVVRSDGDTPAVELFEGEVAVHDGEGRTVGQLVGSGTWAPSGGQVAPALGDSAAGTPFAFVSREGGALVAIPASKRIATWRRGDSSLPGGGAFRALLPLGPQRLLAVLHSGEEVPVDLDVTPEGIVLTPERLARILPKQSDGRGYLAPLRLRSVLKMGQPGLQKCYERALRRYPTLEPSLALRIDLRASGHVKGVRLVKGEAPELLMSCIERVASSWRFPSPGGTVTFEAPLRFQRAW